MFDDPLAVTSQDRIENGEQRWQTVGLAGGFLLHWWRTPCASKMKMKASRWCTSSVPGTWIAQKGNAMSMVRHKQGQVPPMTDERKAELRALAERPDSAIDYSESAPLTESLWQTAVPSPFYKPVKTAASVRIDADVLVWLRSQGKGYQTRMNAILREAMLRTHPKA